MRHHGVGSSRSRPPQPPLSLKSCLTCGAHWARKPCGLHSRENVDCREWHICLPSPAKCLDSWCSVGDGGSPVTTLCSPACLNSFSAWSGEWFYSAGGPRFTRVTRSQRYTLAVLLSGGLAPWFCSCTTRAILIVTGEESYKPIWSDCSLCLPSSSCHCVLSSMSVPKVNLIAVFFFFLSGFVKFRQNTCWGNWALAAICLCEVTDIRCVTKAAVLEYRLFRNVQSRKLGWLLLRWIEKVWNYKIRLIPVHTLQRVLTCRVDYGWTFWINWKRCHSSKNH